MPYMLLGIAIVFVVWMMKKPKRRKQSNEVKPLLDIDAIEALNKKYSPILDEHTKLLE